MLTRSVMIGTMYLIYGPNGIHCRQQEKRLEGLKICSTRAPQATPPSAGNISENVCGLSDKTARERALCGVWVSEKGECCISHESDGQLHYQEVFGGSDGKFRLQGKLRQCRGI